MDLKNLIVQRNKDNPFFFWPRVTAESITSYLSNTLNEEINLGKTFLSYKKGNINSFFQIQNSAWDSSHFGFKCASVKHLYIDKNTNYNEIDEIIKIIKPDFIKYLADEQVKFLFADIPSRNNIDSYFIQSLGFRFILNWIDGLWVDSKFNNDNTGIKINKILPEEVEIYSKLATTSYYNEGRFYMDNKFDRIKVDRMYGELIRNSFLSNDIILTCHEGDIPIGIIICKKIKDYNEFNLRVAPLRFFMVNPAHRNKSFGHKIFRASLEYLSGISDIITTGLETHNVLSLNLHAKLGFKFTYSHNAFHLWLKD